MKAKIVDDAIIVTRHLVLNGQTILETVCVDYDQFRTLPQVVDFSGVVCGLTGWNSDRGYACYKSGVPIAYAPTIPHRTSVSCRQDLPPTDVWYTKKGRDPAPYRGE